MENNGNYLRTKLLDNGIKPTYQRIVILDYLENNLIHPTVDDIYNFNTENTVESSDLKGFKINSTNILINGICKDCLDKENE
ncbi:MAG: hypothetical protein E6144_01495 [Finegoldia magna]|nr:hypothetical protein [Finegoldia magna]